MVRNFIEAIDRTKDKLVHGDDKHKFAKLFGLNVLEGVMGVSVIVGTANILKKATALLRGTTEK